MTIQEMHIGIDLGIQRLNSNVFGELLPEAKDYYINTITKDFVRLALADEKNTVFDITTYGDIREYYEKLQVYIKSVQLGLVEEFGKGYVYGNLPEQINIVELGSNISDRLIVGVKYKILVGGTTDLQNFGYPNQTCIPGDIFECSMNDVVGDGTTPITFAIGDKYRIVSNSQDDFVQFGAISNLPGSEFVVTIAGTTPLSTDTLLSPLNGVPNWSTSSKTSVIPVTNTGYYMNVDTQSAIIVGNPISNGTLYAGNNYIVFTTGATDFKVVCEVSHPSKGTIILPTSDVTLNWDGVSILYKVDVNNNRLVKAQDVNDFLRNSFGSVKSSPISIFADNKLRVYHDNKFNIERIYLDYISTPVSVNYNRGIDSDLPESAQPFLIDLVIKRIQALAGNPTYNAMVNEVREEST
jgi:hypothetical protein